MLAQRVRLKTSCFWAIALLFGILSLFVLTSLSGTLTTDVIHSQGEGWQTIAGESREPGQAESFLNQILETSNATALSVAVLQDYDVVFHKAMGFVDEKTQTFLQTGTKEKGQRHSNRTVESV